jgi:hypothetical protein
MDRKDVVNSRVYLDRNDAQEVKAVTVYGRYYRPHNNPDDPAGHVTPLMINIGRIEFPLATLLEGLDKYDKNGKGTDLIWDVFLEFSSEPGCFEEKEDMFFEGERIVLSGSQRAVQKVRAAIDTIKDMKPNFERGHGEAEVRVFMQNKAFTCFIAADKADYLYETIRANAKMVTNEMEVK